MVASMNKILFGLFLSLVVLGGRLGQHQAPAFYISRNVSFLLLATSQFFCLITGFYSLFIILPIYFQIVVPGGEQDLKSDFTPAS